jgi:serine/threonine-protein kinase
MSPEQLMGKQLDGRSDIYAMGVVAYELLTGRLPFPDAVGPAALIAAQLKKTPEPPSVAKPQAQIPPGVDQLILKMLEKDKAKRHADVNDLAQHVRQLAVTGGQVATAAAAAAGTPAPVSFRANTPAPGVPAVAQPNVPSAPVSLPPTATPAPPQVAMSPPPALNNTEAVIRATGAGNKKGLVIGIAAAVVVIGVVLALVLK